MEHTIETAAFYRPLVLALACLSTPLFAQAEAVQSLQSSINLQAAQTMLVPEAPDMETTRRLLSEKPRMLSYEVKSGTESGWITLSASCESAYAASATTIEKILENYVGAPKIFSRIDWVRIVDRLPDGAITEQSSGIKAFGLKFYPVTRFHQWTSRDADYINMNFIQVASGGTLKNCYGAYSVADRSTADSPLCYFHYSISFEARLEFPGQEAIMRNFGAADIERVVTELGEAAKAH